MLGSCARVLGARAKQLTVLPLQQFHEVYANTLNFSTECEKLGKGVQGHGFSLRAALLSHAKTFIDGMHQNKLEKLGALLEQEVCIADGTISILNTLILGV